jgi:Holliday junction resolvase RusA-like endonuclease|tara:strand:+ start:3222 stop:3560 length:339 start_codon:yes stop_codon:yes gene_type:complete
MKNGRILRRIGRGVASYKSAEAQEYLKDFIMQVPRSAKAYFEVPVHLKADIYFRSNRSDLDDSYLMDCLERSGIIENDRLVWSKEIRKFISKDNPRVELVVKPLTQEEGEKV